MAQAAFLSFDGKSLFFDAVLNETTEGTAKATAHPVEDGVDVSDHIRDELDRITLEVIVTNQPIRDVNGNGLDLNYIELIDIDTTSPVVGGKPLDVPKYRPVPITPGAAIQAIGNAVKDLFSDATVAQVYTGTESAKISGAAKLQNWPTKFNAVSDVVGQLRDWKERGVIGQVVTPWKTFDSMVVVGVHTLRDASIGDAAHVSITLQEIRLVESKLVTAPKPTEPRGKTAVSKGRQPTSIVRDPAPKKAQLKKLTGG